MNKTIGTLKYRSPSQSNTIYLLVFQSVWVPSILISKGFGKHKQVKISDRNEQRFDGIATLFSSSNAEGQTVRKLAQD